jgi:hypothetical protein
MLIVDGHRLADIVDKQLLTGQMLLSEAYIQTLAPLVEQLAEIAVLVTGLLCLYSNHSVCSVTCFFLSS